MPCPKVESRLLAWPRVAVLALVGVTAAGCSDSARFDSSSYTTDRPPQNVAAATPTYSAAGRVEAQPLPAPAAGDRRSGARADIYTSGIHAELRRLSFECSIFRCDGVGFRSLDMERRFARDGRFTARRSRASHANTACRWLPLCRPTASVNLVRSGRASGWSSRATCRLRRKARRHTLRNPRRVEAFTW